MSKKKKTATAKVRARKKGKKKSARKIAKASKTRRYLRDKDGEEYHVLADGNEVPEFLREKGINRVVDNTSPDQELRIPGSLLMAFFGDEIKKRFLTPLKEK